MDKDFRLMCIHKNGDMEPVYPFDYITREDAENSLLDYIGEGNLNNGEVLTIFEVFS